MIKYFLMLGFLTCSLSADKLYIDTEEMEICDDTFFIHVGENRWQEIPAIYSDDSGIYIIESEIKAPEKKWKCPYCHQMWPEKSPCKNANCPSKYAREKRNE